MAVLPDLLVDVFLVDQDDIHGGGCCSGHAPDSGDDAVKVIGTKSEP